MPPGTSLKSFLVVGDGFLEHDDKVADFVVEGWQPGMQIEANPDLTIDVAVDEEPPPADDTDTLSARSSRMYAAVDGIVKMFEKSY